DTGAVFTHGDRTLTADLTTSDSDVPVRVWHHIPVTRWIVPDQCATSPPPLATTTHVPLIPDGPTVDQARTTPVICVACRDRMYAAWLAQPAPGGAPRSPPTPPPPGRSCGNGWQATSPRRSPPPWGAPPTTPCSSAQPSSPTSPCA